MAKKYCRHFQALSRGSTQTLQTTDDWRLCDREYPNVTYSHVRVKSHKGDASN